MIHKQKRKTKQTSCERQQQHSKRYGYRFFNPKNDYADKKQSICESFTQLRGNLTNNNPLKFTHKITCSGHRIPLHVFKQRQKLKKKRKRINNNKTKKEA